MVEKGRVERSIRYIRDNFFAARAFTDVDDLNAQAQAWCECDACDRRWPDPDRVRVLDGATVLATHRRIWDRRAQIEQEAHVQALVDHKRGAREHRATDRLTQAVPAVAQLLQRAAARGHNLGSVTAGLSKLLDRYGATPMQAAVAEALARDVPHPNAVRLALEHARHASQTPPPVDTPLSERAHSLDVTVQAHALDAYDALRPVVGLTSDPTSELATDPDPKPADPKDEP